MSDTENSPNLARDTNPRAYATFLAHLKLRIQHAQTRAVLSVNRELIELYWNLGQDILERQQVEGWGSKVVRRLARDLRAAFPEMKGLSPRNLAYMRALAEAYPDFKVVQQAVAQIPWGHNVRILDSVKDTRTRLWYVQKTLENGWSRSVLVHQLETRLHARQGQAVTNFSRTLPPPQSDLAQALLKDPYTFDFLSLGAEVQERELERSLTQHIQAFLLELGVGFAFVGSQYHLEVGGQDFYLDLLFYHLKLRAFVVVELKVGDFKPEYAGKMNFYLSAVDDLVRAKGDGPSVGLILCKSKERVIVEYALRDTQKPLGVASYQLTASLPEGLEGRLPTVEELEAELGGIESE